MLHILTWRLQCLLAHNDVSVALLLCKFDEILHDMLVQVLAALVCVTVAGVDLKDTIVNGEEDDAKGAAAQVEHKDVGVTPTPAFSMT